MPRVIGTIKCVVMASTDKSQSSVAAGDRESKSRET